MATVVIKVNLIDLTDIIIFADARFDSRVNGEPGSCEFRVRDDNNDLVFEAGQSITVDINGERVWTGYLMQATSTYIFPAGSLPPTVPRIWRITGVDINILFRRRIVVDPDDPTVMTGKTYKYTGTPTPDTTAITSLVTDFLDLSGDALDVSTLVENVGDINVDQDTNAFGASWNWEQAMASIAALPAAIYYLAPTRDLVYTDVDTVDAPFGISDQPDGVTTFGYREPELLKDASNLINEYFAWGIGTGSNDPVFSRLEDATSVTDHGRWQQASLTYDVYRQATVDRIADSWINGSPQSRRGHKDDKIAFMCTVFEPGLQAGMKVDVTSNVFAFNDVIPIRELRLSFANQTDPIYRLTLSHAIDTPWSFYQMFNPKIPCLAWDDLFVLLDDPDCGITDRFNRANQSGWGTSDSSLIWDGEFINIVDNYGQAITTGDPDVDAFGALAFSGGGTSFRVSYQFNVAQLTGLDNPSDSYIFNGIGGSSWWFKDLHNATPTLELHYTTISTTTFPLTLDAWYNVLWEKIGGEVVRLKIWSVDDSEPSSWTLQQATYDDAGGVATSFDVNPYSVEASVIEYRIDNLDIGDVDSWGYTILSRETYLNSDFRGHIGWGETNNPDPPGGSVIVYSGNTFTTASVPESRLFEFASAIIEAGESMGRNLIEHNIPSGAIKAILSARVYGWNTGITQAQLDALAPSAESTWAIYQWTGTWDISTGAAAEDTWNGIAAASLASGSVTQTGSDNEGSVSEDSDSFAVAIPIVADKVRFAITSAAGQTQVNSSIEIDIGSYVYEVTARYPNYPYVNDTSAGDNVVSDNRIRFAQVGSAPGTERYDLIYYQVASGGAVNRCTQDGFSGGFVTDGSDTISLGSPFWIGTSRVWLDGEAQKLGTEYTEDPDEGLIIFTSTPSTGLDVVVTRVIRTPLGGGASRRVI